VTVLRLLADDLTGALDSAAAFGAPSAPVPVRWQPPARCAGSLALDSGTREAGPEHARDQVRRLAVFLHGQEVEVAYKKIDSLLRGHEALEIDALLRELRPERCILAPAFPAQGRVTRGGRQLCRSLDGPWQAVPADLVAGLGALGHNIRQAVPGEAAPLGLSVWDAETDADLDEIVAAAAGLERVLWVGSGGLAAALARRFGRARRAGSPALPRPILGLFGTDHPVMQRQLAAVADHHQALHGSEEAERVAALLQRCHVLLLSVAIPPGTARDDAARRIEAVLAALVRRLDPPGTLLVAGGETLRGLCHALDATQLDVTGEVMPGIPRSILRGGSWDGTAIVSKSGAFGAPDLLRRLIAPAPAPFQEQRT
jgi:uncharacterized protein YgbK (DUF1537 family)